MRFHSIQKCYHRIIVRVPINLRYFFRGFESERKEGEEGGKKGRKIENCKLLKVS